MFIHGTTATRSRTVSEARAAIVVRADQVTSPFDRRVLGTNVPAWFSPEVVAGEQFHRMLAASGTTLLRLPGGSWSNDYDWLGCEMGDAERANGRCGHQICSSARTCRAADGTINGTAEEAAAAVAFFNGSVDDDGRSAPIATGATGRRSGTGLSCGRQRTPRPGSASGTGRSATRSTARCRRPARLRDVGMGGGVDL